MTVTRDSLACDFEALGLVPGDMVMLHAAFRAIRPVKGGPDAVIDALLDVVGETGGLVMFPSWLHSTYDAFLAGGLTEAEREAWPVFDPATAAVHPGRGGAIGAAMAARPEAYRSRNPDRSLVALGAARKLLSDQPYDHGFGPGSPLERLYEAGGKTLNLGAPLYTATILHYAEYLADVPNKLTTRYEVPIIEAGGKVWRPVAQMNRDYFVPAARGQEPDYLEQVIRAYIEAGRHGEGRVGSARALVYEMADLIPFAVSWFERRFGEMR